MTQRNLRCIELNVGGVRYTTSSTTLLSEPSSYFACLLSGDWEDAARPEVFVDRDGELFKYILRFLRASPEGKGQLVKSLSAADRVALLEEAQFFQLSNLVRVLRDCRAEQAQNGRPRLQYLPLGYIGSDGQLLPCSQTGGNDSLTLLAKRMSEGWEIVSCNHSDGYLGALLIHG